MISTLRVIIATTVFSMGIDCPNIRKVIHFGTAGTIEKETGCAGRNRQPAKACLFYGNPPKNASPQMKSYGANASQCLRNLLFKLFLFYDTGPTQEYNLPKCKCCDNCATNCDCIDCTS